MTPRRRPTSPRTRPLGSSALAALTAATLACGSGAGTSSSGSSSDASARRVAPLATVLSPGSDPVKGLSVTLSGACKSSKKIASAQFSMPGSDTPKAPGAGPVTVRYPSPGTYAVTLTCTDIGGVSGTATRTVTLVNHAPVAAIGSVFDRFAINDQTMLEGQCQDADGDATSPAWSLGGMTVNKASITVLFAVPGTYEGRFTCTDVWGASSTAVAQFPVMNDTLVVWAPTRVRADARWEFGLRLHADDIHAPVTGLPVTVSMPDVSNGLAGTMTVSTNSDGYVSFPDVRFTAAAVGTGRRLRFTAPGTDPAEAVLDVLPANGFHVELRWLTPRFADAQAALDRARMQLETLMRTDLPVTTVDAWNSGDCGGGQVIDRVDGLVIFLDAKDWDKYGGALAAGGTCLVGASGLAAVGNVMFDRMDMDLLDPDNLSALALHEMLHALGFGTWGGWFANVQGIENRDGDDPYFSGANAVAAFTGTNGGSHYGGPAVPVEDTGGGGTKYQHWRESVMGRELMTGYHSGKDLPVSATTLGALADLGYPVDWGSADPFDISVALVASAMVPLRAPAEPGVQPAAWERPSGLPVFRVDARGGVVPVSP